MNSNHEGQNIITVDIEKEIKKSYIEYAMAVIVGRALPDVRDGFKPVHRRILYAMYEDGLTYNKPYRKSATTVGNVLGRYHPHGDMAVYDSMVRLAQTFSMRYPLIDGQGNFGNIDGDGAAAYRYTEARMTKLANEMLTDIEKNVIDYQPNFDSSRDEPVVLPSRFPNLLVNGSVGIAVGMATYIPPHNLTEVIDGTVYLMDNPDAAITDLMQFIKAPDFPTGATIYGTAGLYQAYTTGKGHIYVRAKCHFEEHKEKTWIVFTEIPYQVNKSMLITAISELVKDKRIDGISDLRDESGKDGMRIVVECKRDANPSFVLNQLYRYTQLQDTCAITMLALVDNQPKVLNLKEILECYIEHQKNVVRRRTIYDRDQALKRVHILEGYIIALNNIDEVIKIIRASASIPDAKAALCENFGLSELQAQAIVEMPLGRLSGLERDKIANELTEKQAFIKHCEEILGDENLIKQIIKDEMLAIKDKYGDARRTDIETNADEILDEDLIERETYVISMTQAGYIKRISADTYQAQHRGGKGITAMTTRDEDLVNNVYVVDSHDFLLMFTNRGKVYMKKCYEIPEAGRTAKGTNLVNVIPIESDEKVTSCITVPSLEIDSYFTMITKKGVIKRVRVSDYKNIRKTGIIALDLDEDDELNFVKLTDGYADILIASKNGLAARFDENEVRVMGRLARGVRAIKLGEDDEVCGAVIIPENTTAKLLTMTEKGMGKRCEFEAFSAHSRGTKGMRCHLLSEKTGKLCGIAEVEDTDDVMFITNEGVIIRVHACDIPVYTSRSTSGVYVMRMKEDAYVVNLAVAEKEEDEEAETDAEATESVEAPESVEALAENAEAVKEQSAEASDKE